MQRHLLLQKYSFICVIQSEELNESMSTSQCQLFEIVKSTYIYLLWFYNIQYYIGYNTTLDTKQQIILCMKEHIATTQIIIVGAIYGL